MKAVVVRSPGGLDAMRIEQVPEPSPGPRAVLIKVAACGVCFHDLITRNGTLRFGVKMPCILGHEIAGEVVAAGAEARLFKAGDRVCTTQRFHICGACRFCRTGRESLCGESRFLGDFGMVGGYAEYVAVEEDNVALVPDEVPLAESAIVACAIGTTLNAIREVGRVQPGEHVLVTGAGGGLGVHAIQLARLAGAHVVAVTSAADKAERLRDLGAHAVVVTRRGEDFSPAVKQATEGEGVDVALDNVGSPLFQPTRRSIATGGRWVMIGQLTGEFVPFNPAQLFLKNISLLAANSTTRKQLQDSLQLMRRGQIRPVIAETLPLAEAARAHALVEAGAPIGRLLLRPDA
ncbi:MAG: zinc-binding dehydrogenase [Alphaproteobacteria bacterium]|nr:zinc-binding dehydrogenase [Alphaproteobacteria bacterium]